MRSEALVSNCLERIAEREDEVHAWAWIDPAKALAEARQRDREAPRSALHGVPVGIKDVIDTADMPTEYNSPIYRGHQPKWDAASVALLDANCLTGRVDAVPNLAANSCFDGQRIIFVRRCNDGETTTAYWNNSSYDGTGSACIPGADRTYTEVPVLRAYVVELDAACTPKKSWANNGISPLREPPTENRYKQMGVIPEWGDMLGAISPDGNYAAVATNVGPPGNSGPCAGFYYNLQDATIPISGASARRISWCRLQKDPATGQIANDGPLTLLSPFGMDPPETTLLPSFFSMRGTMTLLFTARWAQLNQPGFSSVMQSNLDSDYQMFYFGTPDGANLGSIQAIHRSSAR